jgi:chromosome segregation protein
MRIKRIDISGFKSFCDPTRVVFDHSVTGVVGPNGCGKSNIVDALRWSLGEQSAKNLRGKAMDDIIFNGSKNRGPLSMAEVTITFDNTDGLSHHSYLDFSEIAVTRRLHRDSGTSEYFINKVPCRRMDVTDLFLGTGGGARAYSIIEQGRIGLIVSSRSEDRRAMIEEAAGITKYKTARTRAARKMDQTRQNLMRVTDIIAEMERSLRSLNRQAKKAERFKCYREEQIDLDLYVASHRYLELRAKRSVVVQMLGSYDEQLTVARAAFDTLETRVQRLRLDEAEVKGRLDSKTAVAYEIDKEIEVIENEVGHLLEAVERYKTEERNIREQKASVIRGREELRDESELLEQQMQRVSKERDAAIVQNAEIAEHAELARGRVEELSVEYDSRRDRMSHSRARLAAANNAILNLGRRQEEAEFRLKTSNDERCELEEQALELGRKVVGLSEQVTLTEDQLNTARSTEELERGVYDELRTQVESCANNLQQTRDELQSRISRKESLEEVMNGLESHDVAVREAVTLLEEEGEGLLQGLLIDSLECKQEFERALAATLNDRLQSLLVEDRAAGMQLLNTLKERNMGRVTVAPMTELLGPQVPEVTGVEKLTRLVDQVESDEKSSFIVEALIANVFVVEDLKEAEELWEEHEGRLTFVTMDGQLLEAGGMMRGGCSGSVDANLLGQKRQIRELVKEVKRLKTAHDGFDQKFAALKEELAARGEASETARGEAQMQEITLVEVRKDKVRAEEDLASFDQRRTAMDRAVTLQKEMLAQVEADMEQVTGEVQETQTEIEESERVLEEQTAQIGAYRAEAERLTDAATEVRVQLAALEQQWQHGIERREQLKRAASDADDRLGKADEQRERAFYELGRAAGEVFRQRELLGTKLDAAEAIRSVVEGLRVELDAATAQLSEIDDEVKELREAVEATSEEVSQLQMKEQQVGLSIEHLVENISERHDTALLMVIGDYHLRQLPGENTRARADELRGLIERMGPINLAAIDEFESESKRHEELAAQKDDLEQALEDLEQAISRMDRDSKARFKETFDDVNRRFKEIFPKLFNGGRAHLALTDPSDLLTSGVDIFAEPPGKKLLGNIELLSGGEKALTAVSLLFAIFLHRPSPFCVLDEVDAPLDGPNGGRFIDMVQQMTDHSQFIIITHSNATMERTDALYGITMEEPGVSKMISVRLSAEESAKPTTDTAKAAEA